MSRIVSRTALTHRGISVHSVVRNTETTGTYEIDMDVRGYYGSRGHRETVAKTNPRETLTNLVDRAVRRMIDAALDADTNGTYLVFGNLKGYQHDDLTLPEGCQIVGYSGPGFSGLVNSATTVVFVPLTAGDKAVKRIVAAAKALRDTDYPGSRVSLALTTPSAHEAAEASLLYDLPHLIAAERAAATATVDAVMPTVKALRKAAKRVERAVEGGDAREVRSALAEVQRLAIAVAEVAA